MPERDSRAGDAAGTESPSAASQRGPRKLRRGSGWILAAGGCAVFFVFVVLQLRGKQGDLSVVNGELTHRVSRGDLRISFTERGNIKAAKSVPIFCELEGRATIISVVPEGTLVKQGDLLVEMDSSELTQQLNQQQIAVESAQAALDQSEEQREIQQSLSESALQEAKLALMLAKLDLEKYKGRIDLKTFLGGVDLAKYLKDSVLGASIEETLAKAEEMHRALLANQAAFKSEIQGFIENAAYREGSAPAADSRQEAQVPVRGGGGGAGSLDVVGAQPAAKGSEAGGNGGRTGAGDGATGDRAGGELEVSVSAVLPKGREASTGDFLLAYKKAMSDVKIASAEVARAENQKEWTEALAKKGYVTGTELVADTLAWQKAQLNEQQSKGSLELFLTYTWLKDFAKYQSAVDQTEAALARAMKKASAELAQADADVRGKQSTLNLSQKRLKKIQEQLEKTKIKAPQDGMVVYATTEFWRRERMVEAGAEVHENQLLMNLPDVSSMAVQLQVHESWIDQVNEGLPAFVSIDALPNLNLKSKVTKVGLLPDSVNRWLNPDLKVYQTDVTLDEDSDLKLLRPGMSAKVEVVITVLKDVIFVPVQSVTYIEKQQVCFVLEGGEFVPRNVQGGRYNESFIEIVSGLKEGEVIQLNAPLPKASKESEVPAELDEAQLEELAKGGPEGERPGMGEGRERGGKRGDRRIPPELEGKSKEEIQKYFQEKRGKRDEGEGPKEGGKEDGGDRTEPAKQGTEASPNPVTQPAPGERRGPSRQKDPFPGPGGPGRSR